MAKGFVRAWCSGGDEETARTALRAMPEVQLAELTSGEQDLIAIVVGESYEKILTTVLKKLRQTPGVRNTVTSLVLE